jgi:hypothetical protein
MAKNCETAPKPKTFRELIGSSYFWTPATAMMIGGILGYLYYHFAGNTEGTSTFTRTPVISIISGSFLGLLFVNRPCKSC